jgi:hypothetical protein
MPILSFAVSCRICRTRAVRAPGQGCAAAPATRMEDAAADYPRTVCHSAGTQPLPFPDTDPRARRARVGGSTAERLCERQHQYVRVSLDPLSLRLDCVFAYVTLTRLRTIRIPSPDSRGRASALAATRVVGHRIVLQHAQHNPVADPGV